jgi:hypothetical protein
VEVHVANPGAAVLLGRLEGPSAIAKFFAVPIQATVTGQLTDDGARTATARAWQGATGDVRSLTITFATPAGAKSFSGNATMRRPDSTPLCTSPKGYKVGCIRDAQFTGTLSEFRGVDQWSNGAVVNIVVAEAGSQSNMLALADEITDLLKVR